MSSPEYLAEVARLKAELASLDVPRENLLALALVEESTTLLSLQGTRLGAALSEQTSVLSSLARVEGTYSAAALGFTTTESAAESISALAEEVATTRALTELELLPVEALLAYHQARFDVLSLPLFSFLYEQERLPKDVDAALLAFEELYPAKALELTLTRSALS